VKLPADYVRQHVELAYAEISHANQGRTVDRSFLYLDGPTGASGIYVPMTRGRESNDAFVVIRGEETPADVIAEALSRTWIDRPAVAIRAEMRTTADRSDGDGRQRAPDRPLPASELRRVLERHAELESKIAQAPATLDAAPARVRMLAKQQDAVRRSIEDYRTRLIEARERLAELDRPLLRRRHRTEIDRTRSEVTALPGSIEDAQAKLAELERQVPGAKTRLGKAEADVTDLREMRAERVLIGHALEQDARLRGRMPTPRCQLRPWIGSGRHPPAGPSATSGSIRPGGLRSITPPSTCTERRSRVPPLARSARTRTRSATGRRFRPSTVSTGLSVGSRRSSRPIGAWAGRCDDHRAPR
jgi:hypothetical protein